jgi:hypothetical protein
MKRTLLIAAAVLLLAGCAEWEKNHPYGLLGDLAIYPTKAEQARRQAAGEAADAEAKKRELEPGTIGVGRHDGLRPNAVGRSR